MRPQLIGMALLLVAALAFPLIPVNPLVSEIAALTVIYAIAAVSWNIFSGYTGYIALGHAVFWGLGGYTLALLYHYWNVAGYWPLVLLPVCGLIAMIVAVPLGMIALWVRGHAFVVITIAFTFIFQLLAYNLNGITLGHTGLSLPFPPWGVNGYYTVFYLVGLVILVLAFATSWFVRSSKYGLGLLAIRDDEDRARGLGVRTGASKLIAFVISSFFVGMAGALEFYLIGSIFPQTGFNPLVDVELALMTFLGGAGTLGGPLLGAVIVPAQQYFGLQFGTTGYYLIVYGALFLVVLLLMPEGIIPTVRKRWTAWQAQRTAGPRTPSVATVASGAPGGDGRASARPYEGEQP
jgi:branched-chain amino acid transport system permease protein